MKRILFTIVLFIVSTGLYSQTSDSGDVIIDPVPVPCYAIQPDEPIRHFTGNTEYVGRVIFRVDVDTVKQTFTGYEIVFARLYSRTNPKDSIELRPDTKSGNYKYVERIKPALIKHLSYLKLVRTDYADCVNSKFMIPLVIE